MYSQHMGNCQNYGPFLGPLNQAPYYNRDPKRDHNFDSSPHIFGLPRMIRVLVYELLCSHGRVVLVRKTQRAESQRDSTVMMMSRRFLAFSWKGVRVEDSRFLAVQWSKGQ